MDSLIYLDNAATTAVKPEVFEQMMPYFMDTYSNPASVYSFAGKAKKAVDDAREQIANALNAKTPAEVYFTGGGSEADNWENTLLQRKLSITPYFIRLHG